MSTKVTDNADSQDIGDHPLFCPCNLCTVEVTEEGSSTNDRANTEVPRKLAQGSEDIRKQLTEILLEAQIAARNDYHNWETDELMSALERDSDHAIDQILALMESQAKRELMQAYENFTNTPDDSDHIIYLLERIEELERGTKE